MKKPYSSAFAVIASALALAGIAVAGAHHDPAKPGSHDRMTKLDANKDGKVTLAELTQSKQAWFGEVDANKDGVATTAELDAHVKARRERHVQELFQRKDANRDGRLSQAESGMPDRWFTRNDENRDGALTPLELTQARRGDAHKGDARKGEKERDSAGHRRRGGRLGQLDQNGDGKVERAEVTKSAELMLARLDRNADGALTKDELAARDKGRRHAGERENEAREGSGAGQSPSPPSK